MKYFLFALLIVITSCESRKDNYFSDAQKMSVMVDNATFKKSSDNKIEFIDLSTFMSNDVPFNIYDLVDSVKVIILDDSNVDALIGNIEKVVVTDNFIYIMDYIDGNGVVIFDSEGKFVRRISKGEGPGEISKLYDITYDNNSNKLLLTVPRGIKLYEENGEYINFSIFPLQFSDLEVTPNGYLCYQGVSTYNEHLLEHQRNSILFIDREYHLKWSALPHFNYTNWGMWNMKLLKSSEGYLLPDTFNDTIYQIDENGVYARYVLNLGNNKFPNKFASDKQLNNNMETFNRIFRESNYSYLSYYLETRTTQFFNIGFSIKGSKCFFRDKQSGNIIGGGIFIINQEIMPHLYYPLYTANDWFILPYSMPGGGRFSSPLISDYDNERMANLGEEANPVLFLYKLKHF